MVLCALPQATYLNSTICENSLSYVSRGASVCVMNFALRCSTAAMGRSCAGCSGTLCPTPDLLLTAVARPHASTHMYS